MNSIQDQDQNTPASQSRTDPKQQQGRESSIIPVQPIPSGTRPPGAASPVLQAFQDRFRQFSPDRFQEVKAEASALRSSRGMRLWNQAWLRCQEARQQLQERLQDTEDVLPLEANPASWCQQHMIEVENISVQTPSSGGRSLCVQSTPGPGHPDWEDIVSREKDSGKREVVLNSGAANLENEADGNPSGKSEGSKVTPQPANR